MDSTRTPSVTLRLPAAAWRVLDETLRTDAESTAFDPALRDEIRRALSTVDIVRTPYDDASDVSPDPSSRKESRMRILFINNDGAGFADYLDVDEGTTVESFFKEHMHGQHPGNYLIRVNRQPVARDQVLQEGDRITVTPTKIEGAS